jgi:hypothetical protein
MRGQGYAAYVLEGALLDKSLQAIPDVAHSRRASWSLPFSEIHSLHRASEDYDERMQGLGKLIALAALCRLTSIQTRTHLRLSGSGDFLQDLARDDLTDVIDPIGPSGYLMRSTVARNDPVLINLHTELSYLRATNSR